MTRPRLLLLDNLDSFTFMLADYLASLGATVEVVRNNAVDVATAMNIGADGAVISPGPGGPDEAGISVALAQACIDRKHPLLGVCLGHQAIARACSQPVERTSPVHGKVAHLRHNGSGLFDCLPQSFAVTRYHSLAVPAPVDPLVADAWSEDGTVMAMHHRDAPVFGVQFHPESVATEHGKSLLSNFLRVVVR